MRLLTIIILSLGLCLTAWGEPPPAFLDGHDSLRQRVCMTLSLGNGSLSGWSPPDAQWFAGRFAIAFPVGGHRLALAYSFVADYSMDMFSGMGGGSSGSEYGTNQDFGLLGGHDLLNGPHGYLFAGAGIAYAHVVTFPRRNEYARRYEEQAHATIGVPWNVAAAWTPRERFGLLFEVFGDVNSQQSFQAWAAGFTIR